MDDKTKTIVKAMPDSMRKQFENLMTKSEEYLIKDKLYSAKADFLNDLITITNETDGVLVVQNNLDDYTMFNGNMALYVRHQINKRYGGKYVN